MKNMKRLISVWLEHQIQHKVPINNYATMIILVSVENIIIIFSTIIDIFSKHYSIYIRNMFKKGFLCS